MTDVDAALLDGLRRLRREPWECAAFLVLGRDGRYHVRRDGVIVRAGEARVITRAELAEVLWDHEVASTELLTDDGAAIALMAVKEFLAATRRRWTPVPELGWIWS